jgi:hypothetical protein
MDMLSSTFGPPAAAVVAVPLAAVVLPAAAVVELPAAVVELPAAVVAAAGALVLVASPQAANIRLIISSKLVKAHFLLGIIFYSFIPNYCAGDTNSALKSTE